MIPTAVPWGVLYSNFVVCFSTKYDANLEVMSCQVYFINLSIPQDRKNIWRVHLVSNFPGGWGKIYLNFTTLPRIFIRVVF